MEAEISPVVNMGTITLEQFQPHQDSDFILTVENLAYAMTLRSVTPSAGGGPEGGRRASFSLVFSGPTGDAIPQGVYRVGHGTLGEMDIFLVAIGRGSRDKDHDRSLPVLYQAVFN